VNEPITTKTKQQPPPDELTSEQLASVSGGGGRWAKHPRPRSPRGNRPK
jgi:hypothetical protein